MLSPTTVISPPHPPIPLEDFDEEGNIIEGIASIGLRYRLVGQFIAIENKKKLESGVRKVLLYTKELQQGKTYEY